MGKILIREELAMKFRVSVLLKGLAFIGLLGCVAACNSTGCLENQNSIPLAGFYAAGSGASISVPDVKIGGVGAPNDSLLNSYGDAISQIYLPFRSTAASTSFYIQYADSALLASGVCDTLTFDYTSQPYFASEECGAMYRYLITDYTYTTWVVDSVAVTDSLITNVDIERIKIYFRTSSEL